MPHMWGYTLLRPLIISMLTILLSLMTVLERSSRLWTLGLMWHTKLPQYRDVFGSLVHVSLCLYLYSELHCFSHPQASKLSYICCGASTWTNVHSSPSLYKMVCSVVDQHRLYPALVLQKIPDHGLCCYRK